MRKNISNCDGSFIKLLAILYNLVIPMTPELMYIGLLFSC